MKKMMPLLAMILLTVILLTISICRPYYLADTNTFLKEFVNHEFLAILGFIVALTLASAASLHLELNRIEDQTDKQFINTRLAVKRSALSLLAAFVIAGALVIIKPMLLPIPTYAALANSFAILIVFFNIAVLYDLSATVFGIPTIKRIKELSGDDT